MTIPGAIPKDTKRAVKQKAAIIPFLIGLLYSAICLPPWIPVFLSGEKLRDPSWQFALHEAYQQKWQFGTDVIFTYGPFGFLMTRMYHPETYSLMLAIWVALSVTFFLQVYGLAKKSIGSSWGALLLSAIATRVAALDAMTFLLSFLVLFLVRQPTPPDSKVEGPEHSPGITDWLGRCGLILAVGLLPLTKYTFVPAGMLVLSAVGVREVMCRRVPWNVLLSIAATVLFWHLSGQPFRGLREYLVGGFEVAKNYEPAMSLWETESLDIAAVWCAALLVIALPLLMRPSRFSTSHFATSLVPMTLCLLLFMVWKFTFVAFHPQKIVMFYSAACLISLIALISNGTFPARRQWVGVTTTFGLLLVAVIVAENRYPSPVTALNEQIAFPHPRHPEAAIAFVQGRDWMPNRHSQRCDEINRRYDLSDLTGSIDVFPDHLYLALTRSDLTFRPRPVMQSYVAYSPWLAERNAAHYRSDQAPDHVLFSVDPLDDRFPMLCDSLTWRELLQRYEVSDVLEDHLLLTRLPKHRTIQVSKLNKVKGDWGEWIAVPKLEEGLIWCRVQLYPTLGTKVAGMAYRQPHVFLDVRWRDGSTKRFRYIPTMGPSGFLLSPALLSKEVFAAIQNGERIVDNEVQALRFVLSDERFRKWFYADAASVEFEQLSFSNASAVSFLP